MKRWILLSGAAVGLVGISVVTTLVISTFFIQGSNVAENAHVAGGRVDGGSGAQNAARDGAVSTVSEVFYHYLQPEFIVNFSSRERPRTLMVEITLSSFRKNAFDVLEKHAPELRNNLLLLMSDKNGADLQSIQGKTQLREEIRDVLNQLSQKHEGTEPISEVYFTRFVLQ